MKVAFVTVAHVVLIIIAEFELPNARVYMGRAQEDWSRLAGWRRKRSLTEQTITQDGAKEQRGKRTRTFAERVLAQPWGRDQGREETLRITEQTTAKPSRGPRRLIGKPGGYYVGNEPKWKQWAQKKKKHRRIGQRVSQVPTSPAGKQNETGNQGPENIVPEAGTQQNGRETVGSGGPNNMVMTSGMGGYGRMMDPMTMGMMGMGSMGMGMGYGMTMGMGMGLTAMMAPAMINRATTSIGTAASGIAKAVVAGEQLKALNQKRAKRYKEEKPSEDKDLKSMDEDIEKKSTSKSGDSGTDEGKNENSKVEGEKEKQ